MTLKTYIDYIKATHRIGHAVEFLPTFIQVHILTLNKKGLKVDSDSFITMVIIVSMVTFSNSDSFSSSSCK